MDKNENLAIQFSGKEAIAPESSDDSFNDNDLAVQFSGKESDELPDSYVRDAELAVVVDDFIPPPQVRATSFLVQRLPHYEGLPPICRATDQAVGFDLYAAIDIDVPIHLKRMGAIAVVPTGIAIALPPGHEAQIRPRSGWASKGLTVANSPGTIDPDYRGEIAVILVNLSTNKFTINRGDRIAQLIIAEVPTATPIFVEQLNSTIRGVGGFGSTGT